MNIQMEFDPTLALETHEPVAKKHWPEMVDYALALSQESSPQLDRVYAIMRKLHESGAILHELPVTAMWKIIGIWEDRNPDKELPLTPSPSKTASQDWWGIP